VQESGQRRAEVTLGDTSSLGSETPN